MLDILAHELIHALTPGHGHKGRFKQIAIRIGLEGKMTATIAGPKLKPRLDAIVKKIGKYPHAELTPGQRAAGSPKKQPIRLIKVKCQCGYTVRITRKWLEVGPPHCPLHGEMEEI